MLEADVVELVSTGMLNLNAKLSGLDDDKLIPRVVEMWTFFWVQVLPYVEGVFLPLQTDRHVLSLSRTPKTHRSTSPGLAGKKSHVRSGSISSGTRATIDVRMLALRSFRDAIILPLFDRLDALLSQKSKEIFGVGQGGEYQQPRLQQMLLVLVSTSSHIPTAAQSPGEQAASHLLRLVRCQRDSAIPNGSLLSQSHPAFRNHPNEYSNTGFSSFPRDRRGRIAMKPPNRAATAGTEYSEEENVDQMDGTPTVTNSHTTYPTSERSVRDQSWDRDREREREFLESLKSPDSEYGPGSGPPGERDDRDEQNSEGMDEWNSAQKIVEQMVGMRTADGSQPAPTLRHGLL
jgi:hypothetical protein